MKIAVAIAGVLDPKWPIALDGDGMPDIALDRAVLGPFDESALEIALRLRDLDPSNTISALVSGCTAGEKIARTIAAFRIEDIDIVTMPFTLACDVNRVAHRVADALAGDADLILMGREFGDCDDGSVPALVAARLGLPFFGRVQDVRTRMLIREGQDHEESVTLDRPMLCSVTNDRRNRLRKPLMKNVMTARTAEFRWSAGEAAAATPVERFELIANARAPVECRMVSGAPEEIAAAFASRMRAVRAA